VATNARVHAGERELGGIFFVALFALLGGLFVGFMFFVAEGEVFDVLVVRSFGVCVKAAEETKEQAEKES
jgi:hypothetical protein